MPACGCGLFCFRRDLREADNAGLYYALKSADRVFCVFCVFVIRAATCVPK